MGETAAVLNVPEEFAFNGKSYRLGRRDFFVEAQFERFCARAALEFLKAQKPDLEPLEYAQAMERWEVAGGTFAFSFGGGRCLMTLFSAEGQREMAFLRLARANPDDRTITRDLVKKLAEEYPDRWDELIRLMERLDNPNREKPPEGPAALPAATPSTSASSPPTSS